ncbi:HDOD domain-containing protein [bacterium]|nr:HDOD domain-containing protein [bacterium]
MTRKEDVNPKLLNIVSAVLDIFPELPDSVQKIMTMVYDPKTSSREIAEIAAADPVLVSNILRKLNSAYYQIDRKIEDINFAIIVMGFNEIRDLAIQTGLVKKLGGEMIGGEYDARELSAHIYMVSICVEELSGKNSKDTGILMSLGMLHDIGKFALHMIKTHEMRLGIEMKGSSDQKSYATLLQHEESVYGVNHAIVGGILAEKWNLSDRFQKVIEYHHYPSFYPLDSVPSQYREDVALISIADYMANSLIFSHTLIPQPHPSYFKILGFDTNVENLVTPALHKKFARVKEFISNIVLVD